MRTKLANSANNTQYIEASGYISVTAKTSLTISWHIPYKERFPKRNVAISSLLGVNADEIYSFPLVAAVTKLENRVLAGKDAYALIPQTKK